MNTRAIQRGWKCDDSPISHTDSSAAKSCNGSENTSASGAGSFRMQDLFVCESDLRILCVSEWKLATNHRRRPWSARSSSPGSTATAWRPRDLPRSPWSWRNTTGNRSLGTIFSGVVRFTALTWEFYGTLEVWNRFKCRNWCREISRHHWITTKVRHGVRRAGVSVENRTGRVSPQPPGKRVNSGICVNLYRGDGVDGPQEMERN